MCEREKQLKMRGWRQRRQRQRQRDAEIERGQIQFAGDRQKEIQK